VGKGRLRRGLARLVGARVAVGIKQRWRKHDQRLFEADSRCDAAESVANRVRILQVHLDGALTLRPPTFHPPVHFFFSLGVPIDPQRAV
jgi:hypothetical protein